jgi:hypothetical protein
MVNKLAAPSFFDDLWTTFSAAAIKFKQKYKKIPVLIIDDANKLPVGEQGLLEALQDFAKNATDNEIATVVFISSEAHVPQRMMGNLVLFMVLFVNRCVLIRWYRKKFVVSKWADPRSLRCEQGGGFSVPQASKDQR